jgi:hypothetical protein
MATAAALYPLGADAPCEVGASIDLAGDKDSAPLVPSGRLEGWAKAVAPAAGLEMPSGRFRFLYDAAVRSLVLHSPHDVYPGPYTYKRFWYRDACMEIHAMLCAGLVDRAERLIDRLPKRQQRDGFFKSQSGEWDANGQVLWLIGRYCKLTARAPRPAWRRAVIRGARWILRKLTDAHSDALHAGLLPPGFSAEHLGNNDYYYWDDFWAAAGLEAAADLCEASGRSALAERFRSGARGLHRSIERSLAQSASIRAHAGIPASPYRRMDSGAVGSLAAGYPLELWPGDDDRLLATAAWLTEHSSVHGAFFQDMIHSGRNAYLTLHLAQVFLRAGDPRFRDLVTAVANLASPTGQWPEAVHPRTDGGTMGDGQHVWASAEWVMMMRNLFVREEPDRLVLASGLAPAWRPPGAHLAFGPAPTPYGPVRVAVEASHGAVRVAWEGDWRDRAPRVEVRLPEAPPRVVDDANDITVHLDPSHRADVEDTTP